MRVFWLNSGITKVCMTQKAARIVIAVFLLLYDVPLLSQFLQPSFERHEKHRVQLTHPPHMNCSVTTA
jgi:hypothetical protein